MEMEAPFDGLLVSHMTIITHNNLSTALTANSECQLAVCVCRSVRCVCLFKIPVNTTELEKC